MAKFDLEKYWDFRVWVKTQIAQLREIVSNYQAGGGGTGGGGDFNPDGTYPNMTVGTATKANTATTADKATRATTADIATKATTAETATRATTADTATTATRATTADNATTADYATTAGQATTAESAKTATNADKATTAGYATTAGVAESTEHANTATVATRATVADKATTADSATHADTATKADFATDLSGRVEATPEVFTYRPSAGDKSIKDDNAFIRRIKGNSVVWNQILVPRNLTETSNGVTVTQDGTGKVVVKGTATGRAQVAVGTAQIITGHKYVYWGLVGDGANKFYWTDQTVSADVGKGVIAQPTYATGNRYFILNVLQGVTVDFTFYPQVSDLTAMFGTGNEPTTVEEFRALYPNSYYPYNAGELRNLACSGVKTVGFNEFNGTYARVLPNETYYLGGEYTSIGFAKELNSATETITIPSNRLYTPMQLGYIYATGTDICINLHHTGYRDGEYEPHKAVTHELPLSKITNGEPLRKAGSVYDEINETEYIRRVGVVDLGSYDWYETPNGTFNTVVNIPDIKAVELETNYTCEKYIGVGNPSTIYAGTADNLTISTNAAGRIYIRDDAYKTGTAYAAVPALKASLSGVLLHYELAEPIVTPIETPIDFNYYVEDFGTEEALLAENSAPFSADIVYQFNATDQVRNNYRNIQRIQKTAFKPSGGTSQYIRGDGSYGDVSELSQPIPIYDGEEDYPEDSPYDGEFRLFPQQYAKLKVELDGESHILVRIEVPDNRSIVAEYWLEMRVGETRPIIEFVTSLNDNEAAECRFNGEVQIYATNIWHIITTDGGATFVGEIKNYVF